ALDILFDDGLEFLCDAFTLERDCALPVDIHRCGRHFACARQADADVGVAAFTRTIHHATHDGHVHALDAGIAIAPYWHLIAQVGLYAVGQFLEDRAAGAPATRASHDHRRECPQAHALQYFLGDNDFAPPVAARFRGQ